MRSALLVLLSLLLSCAGDNADAPPDRSFDGDNHQYVLSSLTLPADAEGADALALDLDGDENNDNQLGLTLAVLESLDLEFQTVADEGIARGQLLLLLNLKSPSLDEAAQADLTALFGKEPTPTACVDPEDLESCGQHLTGGGRFEVSASSRTDSTLAGTIASSSFSGGPGTIGIQLPLGGGSNPVAFELVAARAQFRIAEDGLGEGILAGAIAEKELNDTVLPAVHGVVEGIVATDCTAGTPPCCEAGTPGSKLMFLDEDKNCEISLPEFMENPIIRQLFPLDIDLFNEAGELSPREDGRVDSLSFGIGFSAANASFTLP